MRAVPVGREAALLEIESGLAVGDHREHSARRDRAQHLYDDVRQHCNRLDAARQPQADRDRRVEVRARDGGERVRADEHREAEGKRHADETDAEIRLGLEAGGEHGRAATSEHQDERSDELGREPPSHQLHVCTSRSRPANASGVA